MCNEIVDFSKHIMIKKNPLYSTYLPYETRHFDAFRIAYYKFYPPVKSWLSRYISKYRVFEIRIVAGLFVTRLVADDV